MFIRTVLLGSRIYGYKALLLKALLKEEGPARGDLVRPARRECRHLYVWGWGASALAEQIWEGTIFAGLNYKKDALLCHYISYKIGIKRLICTVERVHAILSSRFVHIFNEWHIDKYKAHSWRPCSVVFALSCGAHDRGMIMVQQNSISSMQYAIITSEKY